MQNWLKTDKDKYDVKSIVMNVIISINLVKKYYMAINMYITYIETTFIIVTYIFM